MRLAVTWASGKIINATGKAPGQRPVEEGARTPPGRAPRCRAHAPGQAEGADAEGLRGAGRYVGAFDHHNFHGKGTYTWTNGDRCAHSSGSRGVAGGD